MIHFTRVFAAIHVFVVAVSIGYAQPPLPSTPIPAPSSIKPPGDGKLPEHVRLRLGSDRFREPNYISAASLSPAHFSARAG